MRKYVALALATFVSVFGLISPTTAIDVTAGQTNVTARDFGSFGNVHAAVWGSRGADDASNVWVSYKRGSAAWTTKVKLGVVKWYTFSNPQVTVRPDGSIFVAWVDEELIQYRELAANATAWSAIQNLPGSQVLGQWVYHLGVTSSGESVTIAGTDLKSLDGGFATWTRLANGSEWTFARVANLRNNTLYGTCTKAFDACGLRPAELKIVSNSDGNQVMAWMVLSQPGDLQGSLKNAVFAIYSARRASPAVNWSTPQRIDFMKVTTEPSGYSYFLDDLAITEGGKSAISWTRGLGNNPNTAHVEYSSGINTNSQDSDATALNLGFDTEDLQLVSVGEKIWGSYMYQAKESSDPVTKVGVIGSLSSSKVWPSSAKQRVLEIGTKAGSLVLFSVRQEIGPKVLFSSTRNAAGTWSAPSALLTSKNTIPLRFAVETFAGNSKTVVGFIGQKGRSGEMGLDLTVL